MSGALSSDVGREKKGVVVDIASEADAVDGGSESMKEVSDSAAVVAGGAVVVCPNAG